MSADTTPPPDDTDSYPRESAPHPAVHARRATRRRRVAGRSAHRVPAQPRRHRPRQLPVGRRRGHRRGAPRRRPRGPAVRARRREPAARGAGPPRADPRVGRRDHRVRHRRRRHGDVVRHRRAAVRRRPAQRHGPRAARRRAGVRPPTRSDGAARRLRQRPAAVHRRARRALAAARRRRPRRAGDGHVGLGRLHRRRGDAPLPRATGGAPTATPWPSTRVDTRRVQRWYLGDPADPARRRRELAYPAAGTRQRRRHAARRRPRRLDRRRRVGPRGVPVPRRRALVRRRAGHRPCSARPARAWRSAGSTRRPAPPSCCAEDHDDIWVELVPGVPAHRARRRAGARAPTATAPGACSSTASRSRRPTSRSAPSPRSTARDRVHRQPARRRHVDPGLAVDGRRHARGADRRAGRARRRRRRRHGRRAHGDAGRARRAVGDARRHRAGARTRRRRRCAPTSGCRSSASAAWPPPCCCPATTTARRCPCCSTRTAVRTARAVVQSHNAHLASQWFADQGFAVVVVDGRGTPGRGSAWERAVHHDLATPVLDDQIDALHRRRRASTTCSTSSGWPSGGGASAASSPPSPCCAGPTCSTPPSPGRRSRSGGCTTPTTPSATSATRTSGPTCTTPTRCCRCAGQLTRPLLLIHGLADDNVVAAHTLQLSSALLAAGRPHEVLPLVGDDPHDVAGGGRREPAAAPARLPATFARARRR